MGRLGLFLFLFSHFTLLSQKRLSTYTLGVKGGIVFTETPGARNTGYQKKSVTAGFLFRLKIARSWTAQIEAMFIEKGSRNRGIPGNGYIGNYVLRLMYCEAPVLFQYHKKKWSCELGAGFAYLVHAREFYYDGRPGTGDLSNDDPVLQTDVTLQVGVSYAVNSKWELGLRYSNSLIPIRPLVYAKPAWYKTGMLNCVLALTLNRNFELGKHNVKAPESEE